MANLLTIRPESATRDLKTHKRITSNPRYTVTLTLYSTPGESRFQHNVNNVQDLPKLQDTIPKSATLIDTLAAAHKVVSCEGHTWRNQASIPVATKTLRSLVELEQRAATQISAIQNLKSPILTSPPTKSLIDEIKTRRTEMETMLATLIVLWCNHDPVVMRTKKDLELQLQKGIRDLK
ncbi:hypothetical protein EI94DRAFT_1697358 [Lactarius quietus]|nr:hypothetical protein EI94DRAFT_1697358 [Lactarius quietus]